MALKTTLSLLFLFLTVPLSGQDQGILVEAEGFAEKVSPAKDFAKVSRERAASGGRVLCRIFKKGYLVYRFHLPTAGTYRIWLRYGAKKAQKVGLALDQKGEPEFKRVKLPATGGFLGPGVWKWCELSRTGLAKGVHKLTLSHGGLRLDCIFIGKSDREPSDDLLNLIGKKLDPMTEELVDAPLCPVTPEWLANAMEYRLPAWYERHRVQGHTRLGPPFMTREIFRKAAIGFKEMGCTVFSRHIKSGAEGAWWPSSIGAVHPLAKERNIAGELIQRAHRIGSRMIVYHRHMEDYWVVRKHLDWASRNSRGELVKRRGPMVCFNSPYADFIGTRLLELVELGADGFYFDEVHFPKEGCWCGFCKNGFKRETGLDHPKDPDPNDPVWHKLIDFNNLSIERTFHKWRQAIHQGNPQVVMLVGSNTWPAMGERHLTGRLFRIADSVKTEFALPIRPGPNRLFRQNKSVHPPEQDAKMALGYTLSRDSADGRPAHIWTHGIINEESALYAVAGVMTHGCIANLDIPERTIPNMMFARAFALGKRVSPQFAGMRPLRFAAIHYSELARDRFNTDESGRVEKILMPVIGAYTALLRKHLPVGVVTDSQLEQGLLSGYKVLFLPAPTILTDRMKRVVTEFKAAGGLVIVQKPHWLWHRGAKESAKAARELFACLKQAQITPPIRVTGGPGKMHVVPFISDDQRKITISLCNDFSWVYTGPRKTREGKTIDLGPYLTPPPPCTEVVVTISGLGKPTSLVEMVGGKSLQATPSQQGYRIHIPPFSQMAVIALEFPRSRNNRLSPEPRNKPAKIPPSRPNPKKQQP